MTTEEKAKFEEMRQLTMDNDVRTANAIQQTKNKLGSEISMDMSDLVQSINALDSNNEEKEFLQGAMDSLLHLLKKYKVPVELKEELQC